MGVAVIGPAAGPVRFVLSTDPRERLRVSNANCALLSLMHWERYASAAGANRLWNAVENHCRKNGLAIPDKRDWFSTSAQEMVDIVERMASKLGLIMVTPEDKERAIADARKQMMEKVLARAGGEPWHPPRPIGR